MDRIRKNILFHFPWMLSDRKYLEYFFELKMGYRPDLDNPKTYSEKLQWLKLHDRRPEYTAMVDKAEAKDVAAAVIGQEHIIPTIGVYDRVSDIPWDELPGQFVLKCTHDSGGLVICTDKAALDRKAAEKKLRSALRHNFYRAYREWPYKAVRPRIICEKYMGSLKDYKWFCFDGVPQLMFIASDRDREDAETKFDFYDTDFTHLPFTNGHPNSASDLPRPEGWDRMKEIAALLSKGLKHVRVDLYELDGKIYFGEYTFYHWAGFKPFSPEIWDRKIGDMLKI